MVVKEHLQEPPSPAKRVRLERISQHAKKNPNDFDYVAELLAQCVAGDSGNVEYVRAYVENLQKKYRKQKMGTLVQFKERAARTALKKALAEQQWNEAIQHGLKVLRVNPWDIPTLTGMAMGLKDIHIAEKHLNALAALDFAYKDVAALVDRIREWRESFADHENHCQTEREAPMLGRT